MPFITIIIFGALAGCFALLLEIVTLNIPFTTNLSVISFFDFNTILSFRTFGTLFFIALIEEVSKFIFLFQYKKYTFSKNAGTFLFFITIAILFGIGFSSLEFIFSLQNSAAFPFFSIFKTLLLHISTSLLFAYFIFSPPRLSPQLGEAGSGEADQSVQKNSLSLKTFWILLSAVLLHLTYNIVLLLTT